MQHTHIRVAAVGALLLFAGGCVPLPKRAKAQLIVPHDCIVNIEVQPDTECRQNADGTGRMLCYNLKLNKHKGCEYIEGTQPKEAPHAPTATPQAALPHAEGGLPEPR